VRCGWQEHGAMNGKAGFNEDCSSMIILNRDEYGVDGTTTSKKLLTRARDIDLFVLQYHALSRMPMGCPQTKTCSRIWSCLCLNSLTGVCLHSQSEENGMTTATLHSMK
jgi:hypothetical protein